MLRQNSPKKRTLKEILYDAYSLLWSDIKATKWVIIFLIAYFVFMKLYLHSLCPMVLITGYPCPACGLTRAAMYLIHLDFAKAFKMHPFIYVIPGYVIVFGWNRYIRNQKTGARFTIAVIVMILLMMCYYLWRIKMYFPGEPPMSYYRNNLFNYIRLLLNNC